MLIRDSETVTICIQRSNYNDRSTFRVQTYGQTKSRVIPDSVAPKSVSFARIEVECDIKQGEERQRS